ncbi:hypothetical protein ACLMJK_009333 [Lecanora helva]
MAARNGSVPSSESSILENTPGAFPSTPQIESHGVVSSQLSLSQAVHQRRTEYTTSQKIKIKVGTWNVASKSGTEKDIAGWFVEGRGISESLSGLSISSEQKSGEGGSRKIESVESQENRRSKKNSTLPANDPGLVAGEEEIGIYALGLQEIVDVASATEALRPYSDPTPANKWKQAVAEALPKGYQKVAEQQLIGLYLVVYASPAIASTISSVSTTSVGTGLLGYMGNKGAVTARLILGEATRMVFINCHLSAGSEKGSLERRNWDAAQIQSRTKFEPVYDGGGVMEEFAEGIGDEDFAFWFGDLNYRLEDLPGEDVRRLLMLHTRNEYGKAVASKQKIEHELSHPESATFAHNQEMANRTIDDNSLSSENATASSTQQSVASLDTASSDETIDPYSDPTSLQTTLSTLLTHDQLHSQMHTGKAFHDGWREGLIDFLPTYKYDVGSVGMFDSSEKQRGPSWCDRILFRTRKDRLDYEKKVQVKEQAKKKDNEMKLRGVVEEAASESVLFENDPEEDGLANETGETMTNPAKPELVTTEAGFEDRLRLDSYKSHQRVLSSDHKPLDAVFTLDYDAVDPDLKAKVYQEVAREIDKAENEGRPIVTIVVDHHRSSDATHSHTDPTSQDYEGVNFGDVKYDQKKSRNVTIANTGRVPATLGFVDRSIDPDQTGGVCPPWLTMHFDRPSDNANSHTGGSQQYTLEPGDAANVELNCHITNVDYVRRLNEHQESLEDVLILRIQNGRDYFLPVHANWMQSAFGRSIEKLIRIPEGGVRKLQNQRPDGSSHGDQEAVKSSVPRELFGLTQAIEELAERATAEWSMRAEEGSAPWTKDKGWPFRGWTSEEKERSVTKEIIREGLDTDTDITDLLPRETGTIQKMEALAETLVQFLESLEESVVTESQWQELEKGMLEMEKTKNVPNGEEERLWIMDVISSVAAHSVSFTFLTFMLRNLANEIAPVPRTLQRQGTATSFDEMDAVKASKSSPEKELRREVGEAYTEIFAAVMIRVPSSQVGKITKASQARKKHVLEMFLHPGLGDNDINDV